MVLYGEEEEEMMANSEDPIIRTIWNNKIVAPYNAVPQIRPVYEGKKVFIDWKSGLEPAIFVRYSTPAGDPLIHVASNPVFMPNYPGLCFMSTISKSHMSGALDGTEKIRVQMLGHPMLVQPIVSQKNQKSQFFNKQFFL